MSDITNDKAAAWPSASYRTQINPDYAGNPFIEALPEVCDDDAAIRSMQRLIRVTSAERASPRHERLHLLGRLKDFMQPLDAHVGLFHRMSVAIRRGYVDRNPADPAFVKQLLAAVAEMNAASARPGDAPTRAPIRQRIGAGSGLTLIGHSGVGKTHAVEAVLRCYGQVVRHSGMTGPLSTVFQIVWLKLSVPPDGSIKALCIDFFEAIDELLGTDYVHQFVTRNGTVDKLMVMMGRVSFIHGLGVLVIDELQNLNVARSGGAEKMMNFFKQLRDVMKVPLLTIGTPEAIGILSGDMQVARRNSGLEPMERMRHDDQFRFFCESLFDGQFLQAPVELDGETLDVLHDLSQGIADVVVQLFKLAQDRALSTGEETLSVRLFRDVYDRSMSLMHPFLDDIRGGRQPRGPNYDKAIEASNAAAFPRTPAPSAVPPGKAAASDAAGPGGVAAKRRRKPKGEPSGCLLVRVVAEGRGKEISPYDALAAAGHIRSLGTEALAQ